MVLEFLPAGSDSESRMNTIRKFIPDRMSIKSKTMAKLLARILQRWTKLCNLQEYSIQSTLFCVVFATTGD